MRKPLSVALICATLAACQAGLQVPGDQGEQRPQAATTDTRIASEIASDRGNKSYYTVACKAMAKGFVYPQEAIRRHQQGTAQVRVSFLGTGEITKTELISSSGHRELDRGALAIFERVKRLPPVPTDIESKGIDFVIDVPISFTLQ